MAGGGVEWGWPLYCAKSMPQPPLPTDPFETPLLYMQTRADTSIMYPAAVCHGNQVDNFVCDGDVTRAVRAGS